MDTTVLYTFYLVTDWLLNCQQWAPVALVIKKRIRSETDPLVFLINKSTFDAGSMCNCQFSSQGLEPYGGQPKLYTNTHSCILISTHIFIYTVTYIVSFAYLQTFLHNIYKHTHHNHDIFIQTHTVTFTFIKLTYTITAVCLSWRVHIENSCVSRPPNAKGVLSHHM